MSGLFAEASDPRAVIVALHGGASSAAYFDCPGHPDLSLLRTAAAAGFTAVALDRPGYGASAPYSDAMWDPERRVELAYAAAEAMLGKRDRGAGLFILAHSNGCELALRMAVVDRNSQASYTHPPARGHPRADLGTGRALPRRRRQCRRLRGRTTARSRGLDQLGQA
jgi:pimeloyl-ACP methyl ester carboxylesterase